MNQFIGINTIQTQTAKALSLSLLALSLAACPSKEHKEPVKKTHYIHGNPLNLIEGATLNKVSPFTLDNLSEFKTLRLFKVSEFKERSKIIKSKPSSAESGNEAPEENSVKSTSSDNDTAALEYSFSSPYTAPNGNTYVRLENKDLSIGLFFRVLKGEQTLTLLKIKDEGKEFPIKLLHYSTTPNNKFLSILIQDPSDNSITAIYFSNTTTPLQQSTRSLTGNKLYKYLYGPGLKFRWTRERRLTTNFCGKNAVAIGKKLRKAYKPWVDLLAKVPNAENISALEINIVELPNNYPPFSDLNTNCSYVVDNYLDADAENGHQASAGLTMPISNVDTGDVINANILYFNQIHLDYFSASFGDYLDYNINTPRHEFGHLLGLHHQFDDDIVSVMGYDDYEPLSSYDRTAVTHLYSD